MNARPGIFALARDARLFVRSHRDLVWIYAKPTVVPVLLCNLAGVIGAIYSPFLALLPFLSLYFMGAYILAWHRAVLLGAKPQHFVDPFRPKPGEGKFIGYLVGIGLVPFLFGILGGIPMGVGVWLHSMPVKAAAGLLLAALMIYAVILSMRLSFVLPARSVGVPLTLRETKPVARGLLWPLFAAGFLVMILPVLLTLVIRVIADLIIEKILLFPAASLPGSILIFVFAVVPATAINYIIYARYVTVLSRLYQWSVQNRPLPAATTKEMSA